MAFEGHRPALTGSVRDSVVVTLLMPGTANAQKRGPSPTLRDNVREHVDVLAQSLPFLRKFTLNHTPLRAGFFQAIPN